MLCRSEGIHHFADNRYKDSQRVIAFLFRFSFGESQYADIEAIRN